MRSSSDCGARPPGDRHGWNSLDSYLNIHSAHMRAAEYFIEANGLAIQPAGRGLIRIEGAIRCQHALRIYVNKLLEIDDRHRVRTISYNYHACWGDDGTRPIFRYDNAHEYVREGHPDAHHKHRFNHVTWTEIEPPLHVGHDRWPTLGDVIDELATWWEETGRFLAAPERLD